MIRPLLAALLLGLAAAPSSAVPLSFAALVRSNQVPYQGELVINGKTVLRVSHGPGDRLRQEVIAPPALCGELIVDNGHTRWHYSPRTDRVDIAPSAASPLSPEADERLLARNFRLKVGKSASIAGHGATVVEVLPLHGERDSQRMWLDQATGLPLKIERRDSRGQLVETSEFRSLKAPVTLAADAFEFTLPPGARITNNVQLLASGRDLSDLKADLPFPVRLPSYLPEGFEVMDVHLFEAHEVRSLHWRLSDGLEVLSLFQTARQHHAEKPAGAETVAVGHGDGFVTHHGRHLMIGWETDAGAFTLIGDLPQQELLRIAASLNP